MNQFNRITFLDNLRAFIIVLVVVLHGSASYLFYAPSMWYVLDIQKSLFFNILALLIDIPIMPVLFFIAGYFAVPSLVNRDFRKFIKAKLIRVGAPWLVGALFLAPPIAYMKYYTRAVPLSFLQFWASDFWTVAYSQAFYWFLGVLFFFFIILGLVFNFSGLLQGVKRQVSIPARRLFISFWVIMSLGMFLMNQFFPVDSWYNCAYVLVFQPVRLPLYIGYFGLGIYTYLSGWFSTEGYKPRLLPWAVLWLISGLLYLVNRLFAIPTNHESMLVQMIHAILFNGFCLSSLMAGAALFQQKVNKSRRLWSSLSANSYGIYYIHPFILFPMVYFFVSISIPLFVKAPLVILLSIFLSWAVSAFVLTKAPILRRAFT